MIDEEPWTRTNSLSLASNIKMILVLQIVSPVFYSFTITKSWT